MGEVFMQEYGDKDARLRVTFDNGTESNMLMMRPEGESPPESRSAVRGPAGKVSRPPACD